MKRQLNHMNFTSEPTEPVHVLDGGSDVVCNAVPKLRSASPHALACAINRIGLDS